jgi:hypothetical protein
MMCAINHNYQKNRHIQHARLNTQPGILNGNGMIVYGNEQIQKKLFKTSRILQNSECLGPLMNH